MNTSAIAQPIPFTLPHAWRHALPALLLLLAWILFLYRDTALAMVLIWSRSETFTHGFLVPPIALWLIWRQRRSIAVQTPQPALGAFGLIAGAAFVWLMGDLASINAVTQIAFVALLVLTVPAVLGLAVTRLIIFPLGFLFFAVPIGEFLLPQLMEWTANFTVSALRLSGIPVYREGLRFVIPSGSWSVIEACSGVRYLIASLTVGTLFAYLNYQSSKRRILFVIVSILVPIVANWMRAYMIVMLGHLSGNKLAAGVDHLIYGWVFFGIVVMLMFIIGARWAEPEKVADVIRSGGSVQKPSVTAAALWTTTACFAGLVALPHVALWTIDQDEGAGPVSFTAPTVLATGWKAVPPGVTDFKPTFQSPSAEINNSYASQGRGVGLYLGYYRHQNYDRKLVSSNNVLVVSRDPRWARVASANRVVTMGGKPVAVRTAELRGAALADHANDGRLVVWQIYWINGTLTSSDYVAKVYSAFYRLMGRGDDSAVIIVYTSKNQAGRAEDVLESFLSANYAVIDELLRKTQQQ
ncbi:exosortase A [Rhodoferax sp. UBA5149]|uniref:exosortase A n=1 Tax=Rhodoferax sp. UBA5149 TaxID=1947379 RepID=UPI0025D3EEEA|nr:exosortase A [Rhodoferax sp. UBA5149]